MLNEYQFYISFLKEKFMSVEFALGSVFARNHAEPFYLKGTEFSKTYSETFDSISSKTV